MHPIPFHRRVLLWVFVVAFLVLAPAVVFYTAGYRWNPKKGIIERNGTLIFQTQPTGATITLNGETVDDRTPVTLQNVAPGTYQIRLTRDGYTSWEKTLDVRAERVTFVNNVQLWRMGEPQLFREESASVIVISPDGRTIAGVVGSGSDAIVAFWTLENENVSRHVFQGGSPSGELRLTWNDASSALLLEDRDGHAWVARRSGSEEAELLPVADDYRWDGNDVIGLRNGVRTVFDISNGAIRREVLPAGVRDEDGTFGIMAATGSGRLIMREQGTFQQKQFELPSGAWTFAGREDGWIFLDDGHGWLGFRPAGDGAESFRVPTDALPSIIQRGGETLLLSQGAGELWLMMLGNGSPELLIRSGDRIIGSGWHTEGNDVFYATDREVIALGLDPRDGRERTVLATFDHITGFAGGDEALYISGEKEGKTGIWTLQVE